jgi:hypothetical protein
MWNNLASSIVPQKNKNHQRNSLYDCLNTSFYLRKALNEIDSYIANYECPKKSMDYYTNHIFIHSLGYYSQNPSLKKEELKDLDNMKNLGFAYSKIDDLLCKKSISPLEAKLKMKSILEYMLLGANTFLLKEIEKYDFVNQLNLVQDKKTYLINLLSMKEGMNNSKIDFLIEFINLKLN